MDIITMARELGKLIQQDERYKRIDAAKKANDEAEKLQELIAKFNLKRSDTIEMLASWGGNCSGCSGCQ